MRKIDLGQAIAILANIGVIAGIAFLAFELQQNNELLEAEARETLMASRRDINLVIATNTELARVVAKSNSGAPLGSDEQIVLEALQRSVLTTMEWQHGEYRHGRLGLDDLLVTSWQRGFAGGGTYGSLDAVWQEWKLQTSPEFVEFMEEHVVPKP